ncbi:MAG: hypothetical protein DMG70_24730 [Acidobacteria bacterium]|nr:MAG: hypothetical protein DMG70_24730 [Acidobacteriota bacterium]
MRNIKEEQQCADLFVIPQGYEVLRAAPPPTVRGDPGKAIPTLPWGVLKQPRDAIIDLRARSFEGSKNLMLSKSADMTCARPARTNFAAFPKYIPHVNLGSKAVWMSPGLICFFPHTERSDRGIPRTL